MTSAARPLPLRMRPDLAVTRERFGGRVYHIVKDPLSLRHFRFEEEEYAQLQLLDGRRTLEQIREVLQRRFAPQQFSLEEISRFAVLLHQSALAVSDASGQGTPLRERRVKQRRGGFWRQLASPLSLRFPGFDPTRLLNALEPWTAWCFSRWTAIVAVATCLAAGGLIVVHFDEMMRRLPGYHQFFTPSNLLLMLALTGAIKVLHELGHGLTCRRFGGECHEAGLMFLVLAPCLYCNVTDAWRLTKWRRIAVSAAGMIVELVLTSLAVFGWWFSNPGLWNQLCLGVIVVSGAGTVLINGNPLLRYDGYFILSDLVETPNLAEKSSAIFRQFVQRIWLGPQEQAELLLPTRRRGWFVLYAVVSFLYRCLLIGTIYFFLLEWVRPYGLENVARFVGALSVGGLLLGFVKRLYGVTRALPSQDSRERLRFGLVTALVVVIGATILLVPLPRRVWGTLELEPHAAQPVYVDYPGRLQQIVARPGQPLAKGDVVGQLANVDLEREVAELDGRLAVSVSELAALRIERYQNVAAGEQISEVEETIAGIRKSLAEKRRQLDCLTLRALQPGRLFPAHETSNSPAKQAGELAQWQGRPTDLCNVGAFLEAGTLFCQIADGRSWDAMIAVDQTDIELLQLQQRVDVQLDAVPDRIYSGIVTEVAQRELRQSPTRLSNKAGGELATQTDEAGLERPVSATYSVRVILDDPAAALRSGLRGTARVQVPSASLATRLRRWANRTFHFEL